MAEFPAPDDRLWDYQKANELRKQYEAEVSVTVELDGTVTMKGLCYRDFNSLITAASLHGFDHDEQDMEHRLAEMLKRLAEEPNDEFAKLNYHDSRVWHIERRAIIDAITHHQRKALDGHNKVYGKWEHRYYSFASRWSGPRWKWNRFCKAISEFFARMRRE